VRNTATGCVSGSTSLTVHPLPGSSPLPTAVSPIQYCLNGIPASLSATGTNLLWYTTATGGIGSTVDPIPSTLSTGITTYYVTQAVSGLCESNRLPVIVNVQPLPIANAGGTVLELLPGQTVTLNSSASGNNISVLWSPANAVNNPTLVQPTVIGNADQVLTMTVTSAAGCKATDQISIRILADLIVPNAFSPNGDNINDKWVITNIEKYPTSTLEIFNRYGQMLYSKTGYLNTWDGTYNGKPLPVGAYYWIINIKQTNKKLSGSISIIR
jgi:gliding motility-associated-like protein